MEQKDFNFAIMSLGGVNATPKGVDCKTGTELLLYWWEFNKRKGRVYALNNEQWVYLIRQADKIIKTREAGAKPGVSSKYWEQIEQSKKQTSIID